MIVARCGTAAVVALALAAVAATVVRGGTTASDVIGPGATSGAVVYDYFDGQLTEPSTDVWNCPCTIDSNSGIMMSTTFILGQCYVASPVSRHFVDYFRDFNRFADPYNKSQDAVYEKARVGVKFNSCWPGVFASRTLYQLNAAGTACDLTRPIQTDTISMDRCDILDAAYKPGRAANCRQDRYKCFAAAP